MTTTPNQDDAPLAPYPPLDRDELRRVAERADRLQRLREAALTRRAPLLGWPDTEQRD